MAGVLKDLFRIQLSSQVSPRGKEDVVVLDVGVNRIPDDSKKSGFRLVGDTDFEAIKEKAKAITPVPGGVGPMTITMLMWNTANAAITAAGG